MKFRPLIICMLSIILFGNCSSHNKQLDLLEIDFKTNWSKISKTIQLKQGLSITSEYLSSYFTKDVNTFKIGDFLLSNKKSPKNSAVAIATESQVSFIFLKTLPQINYLE